MKNHRSGSNEGIQGDVKAEVLAVGRGAQAVKVVQGPLDSEALESILGDMRAAIAALQLTPIAHETLNRDLGQLEEAVKTPKPDRDRIGGVLTNLAGKLKMVGVVLTDGLALGESFKKIAAMVHLPLRALGIGS